MALRRYLLLIAAWTPVQMAFHAVLPSAAVVNRGGSVIMASAEVTAQKAKVVEEVKQHMEDSMMMFCVRSETITSNEMNTMRQKFPDTTTVRVVKNTLVKRASDEVPKMQGCEPLLKRSNIWFFVPESDVRVSFDIWNDFVEEEKKEEFEIVGGVYDGELLDKAGVERIAKLPTKQELMQQTAIMVKKLAGGKLARALKLAAGQKLVQAVKAVETKMEDEA